MKKIVFIIILVVYTQTTSAQNVTFGVKGGVNAVLIGKSSELFDFETKFGFQIGGFAEIEIIDKFYFQPELLYSLQGTKYYSYLTRNFKKSQESNIILPILFKYYFLEKFNIKLGPQFDYLFLLKQSNSNVEEGDFIVEGYKSFSWGIDLGLAYDFNEKMGLELRYNYRFDKNKEKDYYFAGYANDSVLLLNFEYRFN